MATSSFPTTPPRLHIRLLLVFADLVYRVNRLLFVAAGHVHTFIDQASHTVYTHVSSWCWVQLMRHATEEEALRVSNRRLEPFGLYLQIKPAASSKTAPISWPAPPPSRSEMN